MSLLTYAAEETCFLCGHMAKDAVVTSDILYAAM